MSSHRKHLLDDEPSRSISGKRHHPSSPSSSRGLATPAAATRRPSFPSYLDIPDLHTKIRLLCEIVATSGSLETSLNDSGISISANDVEEVLKLSYSHPAAAVKFFRWSGPRIRHQHSPYSWNLVVDLLGKNLLFDAMWDAVASMKSEGLLSLATFASIFSSFATAGRPADAIAAFESLSRQHGIPKDNAALNSLLSALSREGLTSAALDFTRRIGLRIPPDSDTYAILLEGFENERNYQSAREVFDEMILRFGWDPSNVPAYDSFLNTVLFQGGGLDASLRWLAKLKEQRCFPGMKFLGNAINECVKLSNERAALLLWNSLVGRNGCSPNTELYNSMISLYCSLNELDAAYRFFDNMVFFGAFPDSRSYNLMLQLLLKGKKLKELHVLLSEMVKNEFAPSSEICDSAMTELIYSGDWETALRVWKIMIKYGIAGEKIGNSLIVHLQDDKRLPEACKYAEDMIDKGIRLQSSTLSKLRGSLQKVGKIPLYDIILSKWKKASNDQTL